MVFGIGEGRIEIVVEKSNYKVGETIKGKVILKLNKPKQAKGIRLEFWGQKQTRSGKTRTITRINEFSTYLSGNRTYTENEEFSFEIPIKPLPKPPELSKAIEGGGIGKAIVNLTDQVIKLQTSASTYRWFIKASLDIPMSFDISNKIELLIIE